MRHGHHGRCKTYHTDNETYQPNIEYRTRQSGEKEFYMVNARHIIEALENRGYKASEKLVDKNGVTLHGLILENGETVRPTVYLDDFDDEDEAVEEIVKIFERPLPTVNIGEIARPENLRIAIANKGNAGTDLTREFLDLEAYVYCNVGEFGGGFGSFKVSKANVKAFGLSEDELFKVAGLNSKGETKAQTLYEVLTEMMGGRTEFLFGLEDDDRMWVLSNASKYRGASAMLDTETLESVASKVDSDLLVLPSSIHEVIVVPASMGDARDFAEMVRDINRTEVEAVDRLSDTVYHFNRATKELTIA